MQAALDGVRAYQQAPRAAPPIPMPALATRLGATLRDYGGSGTPALFVPSLINPPSVLDLSEENSLLRWLAAQGHRVLLLDWGSDIGARRDLSVSDHVANILLPMIEELDEAPALVGYCLGGTMAIAAANLARVRAVATIAAPWHFAGFPDDARAEVAALWSASHATTQALGAMPMEALQSGFWALDPARTVSKFESFAALDPDGPQARAFVALEDWANDGPPIPAPAAREMFENFFASDLPGSGKWHIGGTTIAPDPACPLFNIVSTSDRIVPHATAIRAGGRLDLDQGHVGMVIGQRAKAALWQPLAGWLSRTAAS